MRNKKYWFTSDTHYGHVNICRGISTWTGRMDSTRDFQTLNEMNEAILKGINDNVGQEDVLYHLGDWSFGGIENIWNFRKRIICKDIRLILGNHDQHVKKNTILPNCWHDDLQVKAKELFTSVEGYAEIEIDKQLFVLSHYPMEEWCEMDRKGAIMLHGHVHHKYDNHPVNVNYRRMDVGIDWSEFRPYSLEEILKINLKKEKRTHNI